MTNDDDVTVERDRSFFRELREFINDDLQRMPATFAPIVQAMVEEVLNETEKMLNEEGQSWNSICARRIINAFHRSMDPEEPVDSVVQKCRKEAEDWRGNIWSCSFDRGHDGKCSWWGR